MCRGHSSHPERATSVQSDLRREARSSKLVPVPRRRVPIRKWRRFHRGCSAPIEDCPHRSRRSRSQKTLRGWQLIFELRVRRAGVTHGTRPAFEDGFNLVVIRAPVEDFGVQVCSGVMEEASEEGFNQLGLQIAYEPDFDAILIYERRASAEIDRNYGKRFIHRQHEITGSIDAFAIS